MNAVESGGGEKGEGSGEGREEEKGESGESTDGSAGGNSFEGIGIGPIIACVASVRFLFCGSQQKNWNEDDGRNQGEELSVQYLWRAMIFIEQI